MDASYYAAAAVMRLGAELHASLTHSVADIITEAEETSKKVIRGTVFFITMTVSDQHFFIYHFEDPSQGAFAVPPTGLLGFSRLLCALVKKDESALEFPGHG